MDDVSTLALRVDSSSAVRNLDNFGMAASNLCYMTDSLNGKLLQLSATFLSVNFAKSIVNDAAEGQEALGKFETVLGRFQDKASKVADELVAKFNFDTASAQAAISGMVDTFAKAGMSLSESLDMATSLNKRAADLEAFTNAEGGVAHVAEQLTAGVLGNAQSVRNLGIVLSEELLKAQMMKEKTEGLTFANERAAKMHARVSLMLQQTATADGQVARETDNYSNRLRYLNSRIAELCGSLGSALIPTFTMVVQTSAKIVDVVNTLSPKMKASVVVVGALTGAGIALLPKITQLAIGFKQLATTQLIANTLTGEATKEFAENTIATQAETVALGEEAVAEQESIVAAGLVVKAKKEEALARAQNAKAALYEYQNVKLSDLTRQRQLKERLADKHGFVLGSDGMLLRSQDGKLVRKAEMAVTKTATTASKTGTLGNTLLNMLGPVLKPLKGLNNIFTNLATKLPLATKFGSVFVRFAGVLGTTTAVVGGVIGAFEILKRSPEWVEMAFENIPKVFEGLGKKTLGAVKNLSGSVTKYGKDLVIQGTLGLAQTTKRLLGFQTEASRAYKLNKQIEENNKRRQELLEAEQRQRQAEHAMLTTQQNALKTVDLAKVDYTASKESETTKLTKATDKRDLYQRQINDTMKQINKTRIDASSKDVSQEQREEAVEKVKTLYESLEQLNEQWREAQEEVDQLTASVKENNKAFAEDQKNYEKNKADNAKEFSQNRLQMNLENATTHSERLNAMSAIAANAQKEYEESETAQGKADSLNSDIQSIRSQLTSEFADRALMTLQELASSGDFQSDDAITKWSGALVQLEKAGYEIPENEQIMGQGSAKNLFAKITNKRKEQQEELQTLTTQRDEQQGIANEGLSRYSAMMSANKAITDENEQYAEEQRERQEQEEERQKARQQHYKDLQSQVNDTYFQRELEAQERIYGDDKLGAIQSQYGMISAKGENDWNTTMRDLGEKSKTLDAYNSQLAEYERKEKNGTLSDKEKQERDKLESKRDNLQSEFDSSYSDAIQKRLATQDELLNLENSMRSAYLDEAQKYVDEESENMREQLEEEAEEENERQEREKQEREAYKEELREAVGGQKAITAGSSEAFDIASKIYSRGQENIPPEKKIEDSTKRIEEYVKAMQEQMMAYYTEQANGLTLRMEY